MVEVAELRVKEEADLQKELGIPEFDIENKNLLGLFYDMVVRGSPQLRFSIIDHKGKEKYASSISVEAR
jgi:hypothetical protein